jgi:hypothetical protein
MAVRDARNPAQTQQSACHAASRCVAFRCLGCLEGPRQRWSGEGEIKSNALRSQFCGRRQTRPWFGDVGESQVRTPRGLVPSQSHAASSLRLAVLEVNAKGAPTRARFIFRTALEGSGFDFRYWEGATIKTWPLPAVGGNLQLSAAPAM